MTNAGTLNFMDAFTASEFVDVMTGSVLVFDAGSTYSITGTLRLNGQTTGTRIILNSSDGLSRFAFSVATLQQVHYVDVRNSEVSGTADIRTNFSVGTNTDSAEPSPHWVFGPKRGAIMIVD